MAELETILKLQKDGGGLQLSRRLNKGIWLFETNLADAPTVPPTEDNGFYKKATTYPSLAVALQQFERFHWAELPPVVVHPDFCKAVVDAALKSLEKTTKPETRAQWQAILQEGGKPKPATAVAAVPGAAPAVMKNELQPTWGIGVVTEETPVKWVIFFQDGKSRTFIRAHAKGLVPATLTSAQIAALQVKATGRRARSNGPPKSKAAKAKAAARAVFATFQDQLTFFTKTFEGGFLGDKWTDEERGRAGVTGKAGRTEGAIAQAKQELSKEAFEKSTPEVMFETVKKLLQTTNVVFPIEGAIPWSNLAADKRPAAIEALKAMLHGTGEYAERLDHFAAAVELKDKNGTVRHASWPLSTVFGALYDSSTHLCVKPKAIASEGAMLGSPVETALPVTAEKYKRFLLIVHKTRDLLLAAGQKPRDLMDVYSFICRTQADKPD